jgi:hypothetical protein
MNMERSSAKSSRLSTKRSDGTIQFCDCFFFHVVNEILERGLYDDAIKPGSIVVGGTDRGDDGSG